MKKKIYEISGFDCAVCAAKSENHLNNDPNILSCRIDFVGNKLYVSYKEDEYSIDQLKKIIKEVEDDPIKISENNVKGLKEEKIFTKEMFIRLLRVVVGAALLLFSFFFFKSEENISLTEYWLEFSLSLFAYLIVGYDLYWKVIKKVFTLQNPIDEVFLTSIASIGAFILGALHTFDYLDGGIVVALFQLGKIIEQIATNKSKQAVTTAIDLRSSSANKVVGDKIEMVLPETLEVGDLIVVKVGESIPIDGVVYEGSGFVDLSSLTGEFVPKKCEKDAQVFSGTTLKSGSLIIKVTTPYEQSTVMKIMALISESGENKSKADKLISKFAKWYTPIVLLIAVAFTLITSLITGQWTTYIFRGLEILVCACPCAIVISVPLAYFSAIGLASKNGIIIKGSAYIDELSRLKKLVTDKTGTITHGSFTIQKIVNAPNVSKEALLESLHIAESLSNHPIAKAINHGVNTKQIALEQKNYEEISGMGIVTHYKKNVIVAGNTKLMEKYNINYDHSPISGTVVHCAKNSEYLGYVVLSDEIKETAQPMVDLLHQEGAEIILLTGDKDEIAKDTCERLHIDRYHAELLPEDKVNYLREEIETSSGSTAYIGDGINDAASIKMADIGIAMGGVGSDVAVENADVVIMNDDPAKIYDAMKISKYGRYTAIFNVIFALLVKFTIMIIDALGVIPDTHIAMAVAVIADTGLTVLLIINSLLIFYRRVKRKVKHPSQEYK